MKLIIRDGMSFMGYNVWIIRDDGRRTYVARPTELEFVPAGSEAFLLPEPTFTVSAAEFRSLIEHGRTELVRAGLIPDQRHIEGKLEASERHLADMRHLVMSTVLPKAQRGGTK